MTTLTQDIAHNAQLFIETVRANGHLWALHQGEDWIVCGSEQFEDTDVMPLWSHAEDAQHHCVDEWAAYAPFQIDLEEFLDIWIPDLMEERVLVGINWNGDLAGDEIEAIELAKKLLGAEELALD